MNSEVSKKQDGKVRLDDIRNYIEKKTEGYNKNLKGILKGITSKDKDLPRIEVGEKIKKEMKRPISIRTIRRCIVADPRIMKQGWYFFVDDEARFEKRYGLHPEDSGRFNYNQFRGEMGTYYHDKIWDGVRYDAKTHKPTSEVKKITPDEVMSRMVTEMGFFLVYSLIEACKPFRDKSLSLTEREDLVKYWIKKWIPIGRGVGGEGMLEDFLEWFKPNFNLYREEQARKEGLSIYEMNEESIESVTQLLAKAFPLHYEKMMSLPHGVSGKRPMIHWEKNIMKMEKAQRDKKKIKTNKLVKTQITNQQ